MSALTTMAPLIGGAGLYLTGLHLGGEVLALDGGRELDSRLRGAKGSPWVLAAVGFVMVAALPASAAVGLFALGLAAQGWVRRGGLRWMLAGTNQAGVMAALPALAIATEPGLRSLALCLLGIGAWVRWKHGASRRGRGGQLVAAWGLLLLGTALASSAWTSSGQVLRLDALDVPPAARFAVFAVVGALLGAVLRSGSVVIALALPATGAGALAISSGVAVMLGAQLGAVEPCLGALRSRDEDLRRAAEAQLFVAGASFCVGALIFVLCLPLVQGVGKSSFALMLAPTLVLALTGVAGAFVGVVVGPLIAELLPDGGLPFPGRGTGRGAVSPVPHLRLRELRDGRERLESLTRELARRALGGEAASAGRNRAALEEASAIARRIEAELPLLAALPWHEPEARVVSELGGVARRQRRLAEALASLAEHATRQDGTLPPTLLHRLRHFQVTLERSLAGVEPPPRSDAVEAELLATVGGLRELTIACCTHSESLGWSNQVLHGVLDRLELLREVAVLAAERADERARNAPPRPQVAPPPVVAAAPPGPLPSKPPRFRPATGRRGARA